MKNSLLLLLLLALAGTLSAQGTAADSIGTTPHGLPVLRSYVEPDVVERAKKKYGRFLYCIEKSTAANCQNSYLVGIIRRGRINMEWMCDDPKMVQRRRSEAVVTAQP